MTVILEILTDAKMKDLLGDKYQGAVYYNYDLGAWNVNSYMGTDLGASGSVALPWLDTAKETLESTADFSRWQVVALVSMLVEGYDYPGLAKTKAGMKNAPRGNAIVSTVVCRNKRTGKIEPVSQNWVGAGHFTYPENAIRAMPMCFARAIYDNGTLRSVLIENTIKKR